jgi:hypothetical membrane protein
VSTIEELLGRKRSRIWNSSGDLVFPGTELVSAVGVHHEPTEPHAFVF